MEKNKKTSYLSYGLILSLVIHGAFILVKFTKSNQVEKTPAKKQIELSIEDLEQYKKLIQTQKLKSTEKKQIVNTEHHGREEALLDSKFLGERNQAFDRQTVAAKVDIFNKAGLGNNKISDVSNTNSKQVNDTSEKKQVQKVQAPKKLSLGDLALNPTKEVIDTEKFKKEKSNTKIGIKNGDSGSRGIAANNDFIENMPLGDFTHLNTTEFKYYGFYHRIRQKLEQFWGNSLREKSKVLYSQGRRVNVSENYVTSLVVSINEQGEIVNVKMAGSSGVKELDDAAIESFNQAGPFPNPPKGLVVDGVASVEWGFVVKG